MQSGALFGGAVKPMPDAMARMFEKSLPKEQRAAFRQQQARLKHDAEVAEQREKDKLFDILDSETLMRFAYVPFVVAELAWDYAESILDLVSYMKIDAVKGVGRAIRQLRREYEQLRAPYIDAKHRNSELDNMLVFEDGVKDLTSLFLVNLKADLKSEYPDLEDDCHYLLLAVYECLIVLRALFYYASKQRELMAGKVGHPIGDILPPQLRKLETLVQCYIGDKPISEKFQKQQDTYIVALSNRMMLIGLNEIK